MPVVQGIPVGVAVTDAAEMAADGVRELETRVVVQGQLADGREDQLFRRVLDEPLGFGGEIGHAVDLVPEELDADRLTGGGIDVHDPATHRKLSRRFAELDPHIARVREAFRQDGGVHGPGDVHRHAELPQPLGRKGDLQNGLRRGGDHRGAVFLRQDACEGGEDAEPLSLRVVGGADVGEAVLPGRIPRRPDAEGDEKIPGLRRATVVGEEKHQRGIDGGKIRGQRRQKDLFRSVAQAADREGLSPSEDGSGERGGEGGVLPVHAEEVAE